MIILPDYCQTFSVKKSKKGIYSRFRFRFEYFRYRFLIVFASIFVSIFVFVNDSNVFSLTTIFVFVFVNEINTELKVVNNNVKTVVNSKLSKRLRATQYINRGDC